MFILRDYDMECHIIPRSVNRYPDGTLGIGTITKYIDSILWIYEGDDELFTLQCLKEHALHDEVELIMPYIPHARMDRIENEEVFTLKTFCKIINSMGFSQVVVADPHSNVSIALLDNLTVLSPKDYIQKAMNCIDTDDLVLFFPDEGAMKRYSKMFPDIPYAYGLKNRNWGSGSIRSEVQSLKVENGHLVKNNTILIVDDICSKGGTFDKASEKLRGLGAKDIYLYVTHCENTVYRGAMYQKDIVKKIFTTDSLNRILDQKIETIYSFAEEFKNGKVF